MTTSEDTIWMPEPSERDWKEDFSHENGNYVCICVSCGETFYGHKRRVVCKTCSTPSQADLKRGPPSREFHDLYFHTTPMPDVCDHDFQGHREFEDGRGGEAVCTKCGMGAIDYTLKTGI